MSQNDKLIIRGYGTKALIVHGDTKKHKDILNSSGVGGKWCSSLVVDETTRGAWVFSLKKLKSAENLQQEIAKRAKYELSFDILETLEKPQKAQVPAPQVPVGALPPPKQKKARQVIRSDTEKDLVAVIGNLTQQLALMTSMLSQVLEAVKQQPILKSNVSEEGEEELTGSDDSEDDEESDKAPRRRLLPASK